jgi:hypothetical protein
MSWLNMDNATLLVNALTPISVAVAGLVVARATKRLETSQWVNQKLIERKIDLIGQISPRINDLYAYFMWIGTWKEQSPVDVINNKRALDKLVFSNKPFLSTDTVADYQRFMAHLFAVGMQAGADARLRTTRTSLDGDRRVAYNQGQWLDNWDTMFVAAGQEANRKDVDNAHDALLERLAREVGAK